MILATSTVGRKTPLDGKLEITDGTASRLAALGAEFTLDSAGRSGTARLTEITCTCEKAAPGTHVHRFVESPLLRSLPEGATVRLELDGAHRVLRIAVEGDSV